MYDVDLVAGVVSNLAEVCLNLFLLQCSAIIYLRFITTPLCLSGYSKWYISPLDSVWGNIQAWAVEQRFTSTNIPE